MGRRAPRALALSAPAADGHRRPRALSIDMFLPSLPAMTLAFGSDAATAQLTVTLFSRRPRGRPATLGSALRAPRRRRVLLTACRVRRRRTACAFAPSMSLLVAARVVQALGAGSGPVIARAVGARTSTSPSARRACWRPWAPRRRSRRSWRRCSAAGCTCSRAGAPSSSSSARSAPPSSSRRGGSCRRPTCTPARARAAASRRSCAIRATAAYVAAAALMFSGHFAFITGFVLRAHNDPRCFAHRVRPLLRRRRRRADGRQLRLGASRPAPRHRHDDRGRDHDRRRRRRGHGRAGVGGRGGRWRR